MRSLLNGIFIAAMIFMVAAIFVAPFIPRTIPRHVVITRTVVINGAKCAIGDGDDGETYLTPSNKTSGDTIFITEH